MISIQVLCFGFVTVDVILLNDQDVLKPTVGGTAANVCTALNYMGVSASIVATVGADARGDFFVSEFEQRGISPQWIERKLDYTTPFCIELLDSRSDGYRSHGFRAVTFNGQLRSSRFFPPDREIFQKISNSVTEVSVIYSNKQFAELISILDLYDSVFIYEPDCIDDFDIHQKLVARADVYKFSHDQFIDYSNEMVDIAKCAVIETFGAEGVRFRPRRGEPWQTVKINGGPTIVDPTGAGDWFTASLIKDVLGNLETRSEFQIHPKIIEAASKIATTSCSYKGALGMTKDASWRHVLSNLTVSYGRGEFLSPTEQELIRAIEKPHSFQ